MVLELLYNLAILVAFLVISGFLDARWDRVSTKGKLSQGILFGMAAVIGMLQPFVLAEGLIFDGRSVVISLCALFFGPIAGLLASILAAIVRIDIGGPGMMTGLYTIAEAYIFGTLFFLRRKNVYARISVSYLYLLGWLVHVTMILLFYFTLPNLNYDNLKIISINAIVFYPIATVLIGKILNDQMENKVLLRELRTSEERFRQIFNSTNEAIFIHDAETGVVLDVNSQTLKMYGFTSKEELMNLSVEHLSAGFGEFSVEVSRENIRKAKEEGPHTFDWLAKDKLGNLFWVEVSLKLTKIGEKERIIAVVRDIGDRKKTEDILLQNLREKEVLLAEIHHRVKNNLAIISSLLTLKTYQIEDDVVKKLLYESIAQVKSMSLVHEMVYQNEHLDSVDFGEFLNRFVPALTEMFSEKDKKISIEIDAGQGFISLKESIPCALLISELVTNAYKHAFRGLQEGIITIRFQLIGGLYSISVEDNGIGTSESEIMAKSGSMGFSIISGLVDQLGGQLTYLEKPHGFGVRVVFKSQY